ncbi:MAG TPA: ComEA family DNA-binding protein [Firmicutes bacterium]|nr:ComEA family DNA-binding protein [Bacillota bacterium]
MKNNGKEYLGPLIICLAVFLALGWRWYTVNRNHEPGLLVEQGTEKGEPVENASIRVHVAGAVVTPGVYTLPAGSRALEAVEAAGGALPEADQHAINLAQPLYDGQRVEIPFISGDESNQKTAGGGLVNLNTASQEVLEKLPGIGPVRAARIIAYREQKGWFKSVDELADVPGIGPKTLATLRNLVTVY